MRILSAASRKTCLSCGCRAQHLVCFREWLAFSFLGVVGCVSVYAVAWADA
jgi:hypothetical protein